MGYLNRKGQVVPAAATLTDLYAMPTGYQGVISAVKVCNRGVAGTFRVSVADAAAADAVTQYHYYDLTIPANDTFSAVEGWLLSPTDVVRCYASHGNMTFTAYARLEPI